MRSFKLLATAVSVGCLVTCVPAAAQDFPSKPIRIIIPTTPASGGDLTARAMAPEMSRLLGQPVVVENRVGASGRVAYEYVARQAPPDGHTLASVFVPIFASLPITFNELRFDPQKDLRPFIGFGEGRYVFGSSAIVPWKTFNELVAYAKANPGKLNYGASSSLGRLQTEALVRELALQVTAVPYSAGSAYLNALVSGEVQMGFLVEGLASGFGDKFRVLAVTGDSRLASFPDAPTFIELGHPRTRSSTFTFSVRTGTPKPVVDKLYAAASRALQHPEVKAVFAKMKLESVEYSGEAAEKLIAEEIRNFGEIAKAIGLERE